MLDAVGVDVLAAGADGPVAPESPVRPRGPVSDELVADPVRPKLCDEEPAVVNPEAPDVATGLADRNEAPPVAPPADDDPTLEPPTAAARPLGESRAIRLGPPPAENGRARPPGPPCPPIETARIPLDASPVLPERAAALDAAPLLADESAPPAAKAAPVGPE